MTGARARGRSRALAARLPGARVESALALLALVSACLPRGHVEAPREGAAAVAGIEARADALVAALQGASFAGPRCHAQAAPPRGINGGVLARPGAQLVRHPLAGDGEGMDGGVLASPGQCTVEQTRAAFDAVLLALARDLSGLAARLRRLNREEPLVERNWGGIHGPVLRQTADHLDWMVAWLELAHGNVERASWESPDNVVRRRWQRAGERYEAALLGAQVLSLWMKWLEVAKTLHRDTELDVEWILARVWGTWREVEPVLGQLRSGRPKEVEYAARALEGQLAAWSEALYRWGVEAERHERERLQLVQQLLLVQVAFDVLATRQLIGPAIAARARPLAFVLPGIGGVTAGGAATGVRVVISAEWVAAMQHLAAIGAVVAVDVARIAPMAMSTPGEPWVRHRDSNSCRGACRGDDETERHQRSHAVHQQSIHLSKLSKSPAADASTGQ